MISFTCLDLELDLGIRLFESVEKILDASLHFILEKGSIENHSRLIHKFPDKLKDLNINQIQFCENQYKEYLSNLRNLSVNGFFPYNLEKGNPKSILNTGLVLSRLIEFNLSEDPLSRKIVERLLEIQDSNGWWRDSNEIQKVKDLPFYQDPTNASVRIFNTAFISSVLTDVADFIGSSSMEKSAKALQKVKSENGVISGFPQSNWFSTKLFAKYFGLDKSEFLLHWSVLSDLADNTNDPGSLSSIAENLLEAGVPNHDPLVEKCIRKIKIAYTDDIIDGKKYRGWKDSTGKLDTTITLQCLVVLFN